MTRPPPLFWSLVATAVVFWPALSGRHVYDDDLLIRQNVALREFLPLRLVTEPYFAGQVGYWRPVASLLMSAAHALAGLAGIHALVLVAHAFAGAVAFRLGVRLFGDARAAAAAAACFLFHPAQVESVSWASAASGPLAGLGTLLAIAAALRWRDRGDGLPWLVALTWFLALLARESAIVGLLLIPAFVAWAPGRTRPVRWRPLLALVGAAALAWGALRLAVLAQPFGTLGAAAGEPADAWRLVAAPAELLLRHLRLLAVPYPLTAFHPFAERTGAAAAVLFLVAAAGLVGLGLLARRSTAPVRLGCLLAVVPILPFVVHYRILGHHPIAERYLYLSALGLGLLVAAGTAGRRRWFAWALAACFGAASFAQTWVWQEQRCLVAHGLRHAPADALLHVMAGNLELAAG
ncbi:MAG: hypothetical protein FJ265_19625, partial [Planctomycetes bacterium]|nr:hypothetical protein [Planctomycetota bacterium]